MNLTSRLLRPKFDVATPTFQVQRCSEYIYELNFKFLELWKSVTKLELGIRGHSGKMHHEGYIEIHLRLRARQIRRKAHLRLCSAHSRSLGGSLSSATPYSNDGEALPNLKGALCQLCTEQEWKPLWTEKSHRTTDHSPINSTLYHDEKIAPPALTVLRIGKAK
jgi:hypothetical protein